MNKNLIITFTSFLLGCIVLAFFYNKLTQDPFSNSDDLKHRHQFIIAQAGSYVGFDLVDPAQAPLDIQKNVERGYRLITNTPLYASNYVKNQLSCTNCHFSEGDTLGGRNSGISLVGVTTVYPSFSQRAGKVISLEARINSCFERSMNGLPLPENSQEMQDIVAYLKWISNEVSHIRNIPWLGLSYLKGTHKPNAVEGKKIYHIYCALCHKEGGQGGGRLMHSMQKQIPALWGPNSFNDGAGMNTLPTLAAFIYWNMPQNNSVLSEEQALDVAAFILEKPRSHFNPIN